jgi:hypothetical protein
MTLRELLEQMVKDKSPVLLKDGNGARDACALLSSLSAPFLRRQVHLQPGLYVAMINDKGYLGEVLFKLEPKAS